MSVYRLKSSKIGAYNFCIQYMYYDSKCCNRDSKWWEIDFDLMHLSSRKIFLNYNKFSINFALSTMHRKHYWMLFFWQFDLFFIWYFLQLKSSVVVVLSDKSDMEILPFILLAWWTLFLLCFQSHSLDVLHEGSS